MQSPVPVPVFINAIGTATPPHEGHAAFLDFVPQLLTGKGFAGPNGQERERKLFQKLAAKAQINTRYSVLRPASAAQREQGQLDQDGLYSLRGFPSTEKRMQIYEREAPDLACAAAKNLFSALGPEFDRQSITHIIVSTCTGFSAPGLDLELQRRLELNLGAKRTVVGFMGCYAAINALRLAWSTVRSEPSACVLVVSCELCSLHLQREPTLDELLGFLQFADGAAAALVTAKKTNQSLAVDSFATRVVPARRDLIQWHINNSGFNMQLSLEVPQAVGSAIDSEKESLFGKDRSQWPKLWAIHPGGRSILDAVVSKLELEPSAVDVSRSVLREFGNMSSATVLFVLQRMMLESKSDFKSDLSKGVAMAFGPGLTIELMNFSRGTKP